MLRLLALLFSLTSSMLFASTSIPASYGSQPSSMTAIRPSYCGLPNSVSNWSAAVSALSACMGSQKSAMCAASPGGQYFIGESMSSSPYSSVAVNGRMFSCLNDAYKSPSGVSFTTATYSNQYYCSNPDYPNLDTSVEPPVCRTASDPNEDLCKQKQQQQTGPQQVYHGCGDETIVDEDGCSMSRQGSSVCAEVSTGCRCASDVVYDGGYISPDSGSPTQPASPSGELPQPVTETDDCVITPSNPSCTGYEEVTDPDVTDCVYVNGQPVECETTPGSTRNTVTEIDVETTTDAEGNVTTTTTTTTTTTICTSRGCSTTVRVDVVREVRNAQGEVIGGGSSSSGDGAGGATDWRGGNTYSDTGRLNTDNSDLIDPAAMPDLPNLEGDIIAEFDTIESSLSDFLSDDFRNGEHNLSPSDGSGISDFFDSMDTSCVNPQFRGHILPLCDSADKLRPILYVLFTFYTVIFCWRRISETVNDMGS